MNAQVKIKKQSLGFFPTPLRPARRLSQYLGGPEIFIKRDDLSGLALGGNKVRKLEYLLGDALAAKAECVITAGAAQSNHCRQTAAAAALLDLECHLMLGGRAPASATGNLLLDHLFNAQLHWCGEHRKGEDIPALAATLEAAGKRSYVIPYGGSNAIGALGFVEAMQEIHLQSEEQKFTHIFFASSSGATHAGMMLGKSLTAAAFTLVGINIDKVSDACTSFEQTIVDIANASAELCSSGHRFALDEVMLAHDYTGDGYGVLGEAEKAAIKLLASKEGILLDPVYTGRAMAGLLDWISRKKLSAKDRVLFWHTGGTPALFACDNLL